MSPYIILQKNDIDVAINMDEPESGNELLSLESQGFQVVCEHIKSNSSEDALRQWSEFQKLSEINKWDKSTLKTSPNHDRWEHCNLHLNSMRSHRGGSVLLVFKGPILGWGYDCHIDYYRCNGDVEYVNISNADTPLDYNPFKRAFAKLTAEGWELVTVQHANVVIAMAEACERGSVSRREEKWDGLSNINKTAYFKRRMKNDLSSEGNKLS